MTQDCSVMAGADGMKGTFASQRNEFGNNLTGKRQAPSVERVSDAEIARLISVALEDALSALAQKNPERALEMRTHEARSAISEIFMGLPRAQRSDETVRAEYHKAIVFQDITVELAFKMVDAIRRYATVHEGETTSNDA